MAEAMNTGNPYRTHLNPPPGPLSDATGNFLPLPDWKPGQPKPANWPPHIHPPRGEEGNLSYVAEKNSGASSSSIDFTFYLLVEWLAFLCQCQELGHGESGLFQNVCQG